MAQNIHITAEAKDGSRVDLYFVSLKQAKFFNPTMTNFQVVSSK